LHGSNSARSPDSGCLVLADGFWEAGHGATAAGCLSPSSAPI